MQSHIHIPVHLNMLCCRVVIQQHVFCDAIALHAPPHMLLTEMSDHAKFDRAIHIAILYELANGLVLAQLIGTLTSKAFQSSTAGSGRYASE